MNRIRPVLRFHWLDSRFSFFVFWGILISIFALTLIITLFYNNLTSIQISGFGAILIYTFIAGIISPKDSLHFALGLSIRRKDFFRGTALFFVLQSLVQLLLVVIILSLEKWLERTLDVHISFFHFDLFVQSTPQIILFALLVMLHQFMFGFALISIFHRFGRFGMFMLGGASFLFLVLMSIFNGWKLFIPLLELFDSGEQFMFLFIPVMIIIHTAVAFACIRRVTIQN